MGERDLLTVADRVQLLVNAISDETDSPPVVKCFTPDGNATWLISEVDPDVPTGCLGFVISASAILNSAMSALLK